MARQRHSSNPAKVKAQFAALQGQVSAPAPATHRVRAAFWLTPVLAMAGAAMLIFAFAPHDVWPLAYVALAPWTLALLVSPKRWWGILWCFLAGAAFFSISTYWIALAEGVGYIAMQPYLWLYFLAAAIALGGLRGLLRHGIGAWIALPVIWVALEFARAYIISGFPWFFLGHTQYRQIRLIQIADLTSDYGVSFFVAMVNGAIVDVLRGILCGMGVPPMCGHARTGVSGLSEQQQKQQQQRNSEDRAGTALERMGKMPMPLAVPILAVVVTLAVLMGYGTWRLAQAPECTMPGPIIALVQPAIPIALDRRNDSDEVMREHVKQTEALIGKGCQLVVWPETMLPKGLNAQVLNADLDAMKSDDLYCLAERLWGPRSSWETVLYNDTRVRMGLKQVIHGGAEKDAQEQSMEAQARKIGDLSKKLGCPILAGGAAVVRNPRAIDSHDLWITNNCALWFDGGVAGDAGILPARGEGVSPSCVAAVPAASSPKTVGGTPTGHEAKMASPHAGETPATHFAPKDQYAKVHLVPFGEYVPFKYSWRGLYDILRWFVPPVMEQLEPGTKFNHFTLTSGKEKEKYRIATPICYEGAFARVCRDMVRQDRAKSVDILANMSNDGWFTRDGQGTTEQAQHLSMYVFRAIENRVPVVRAVNTGISASIDSSGRIVAAIEPVMSAGTLVLDGLKRNDVEYQQGHGPVVLVDNRMSLYDLVGDLFAEVVAVAALCLLGWAWWKQKKCRMANDKGSIRKGNVNAFP